MSRTLAWAPLPDGRPWWPCVLVDAPLLDPVRHGETLRFWEATRARRGKDPLNKDVLIVLFAIAPAEDDEGHRFAVIPLTSLRPYQLYAQTFASGMISSGKDAGKPCSEDDRIRVQMVVNLLTEFFKRLPMTGMVYPQHQMLLQQSTNPYSAAQNRILANVMQSSSSPVMSTATMTPATGSATTARKTKHVLEENKDLTRLKKELSGVRRKISTRNTLRSQSTSPSPLDDFYLAGIPITPKPMNAPSESVTPRPYPELNSQTLRIWDFCNSFSKELELTKWLDSTSYPIDSPIFKPYLSIASFEAALAEPECSMFAQVACQLVSYLSRTDGVDPEDRWEFNQDKGTVTAKLGSNCTPLTWECLWETLVEKGIVKAPADPTSKRDILDTLVQACSEVKRTKEIFNARLAELAIELSTSPDAQLQSLGPNSIDSQPLEVARRNPTSEGLKILTSDIFECKDLFRVEQMIDELRPDHELLDALTGFVLWRSPELANAIVWEEKLLARFMSSIRAFQLSKRTRTMSFGKDLEGRSLFSFCGDEEEECRIWARDDETDKWFVYQGEQAVIQLAHQIQDKETKLGVLSVLYAYKSRFRPPTVAAVRMEKNTGWRFTGNILLGRTIRRWTKEWGVCPGVVAAWRVAHKMTEYRIVYTKGEWSNGFDAREEEVLQYIALSERLVAHLCLSAIPPHPLGSCMWIPCHQEVLVLVQCPQLKYFAYGVLLATSASFDEANYDAVVLADGGKFVFLFGRQVIEEAINLGARLAAEETVRYGRIQRFSPLKHHVGPAVGAQGVVNLWGNIQVESFFDLRVPMLASEDAFAKRAPNMWIEPSHRHAWRTFVQNAQTVRAFAMSLECLLEFAHKAAIRGYFNQPEQEAGTAKAESTGDVTQNGHHMLVAKAENNINNVQEQLATQDSRTAEMESSVSRSVNDQSRPDQAPVSDIAQSKKSPETKDQTSVNPLEPGISTASSEVDTKHPPSNAENNPTEQQTSAAESTKSDLPNNTVEQEKQISVSHSPCAGEELHSTVSNEAPSPSTTEEKLQSDPKKSESVEHTDSMTTTSGSLDSSAIPASIAESKPNEIIIETSSIIKADQVGVSMEIESIDVAPSSPDKQDANDDSSVIETSSLEIAEGHNVAEDVAAITTATRIEEKDPIDTEINKVTVASDTHESPSAPLATSGQQSPQTTKESSIEMQAVPENDDNILAAVEPVMQGPLAVPGTVSSHEPSTTQVTSSEMAVQGNRSPGTENEVKEVHTETPASKMDDAAVQPPADPHDVRNEPTELSAIKAVSTITEEPTSEALTEAEPPKLAHESPDIEESEAKRQRLDLSETDKPNSGE